MRILIVEDDRMASLCIKKIFQKMGYGDTVVAFTGEQALEMFAEHCPELVLMDIGLPGMDGIETARRMSESPRKFSIVFITAYSDDETVRRAKEAKPVVGYVTKPIDESDIRRVMNNVQAR